MSSISPFREDVALVAATETVPYELEDVEAPGETWYPRERAESPFAEPVTAEPEAEKWEEAFDFGDAEAEAETAHPILRLFPLPGAVLEALANGLSSLAVGLAVNAGYRDVTQLTNIVFYFRHPDLIGRKIRPDERELAQEWLAIRDRVVKPALSAAPAVPATPAAALPAGLPALSADGLVWPEAPSAEALEFMKAVYRHHAERSAKRGGSFVTDLPKDALAPIEGREARKDAAGAARALLAEARAALAAEGLADKIRIGIVSAYRPATRQFEIWQGRTFAGKSTGGGFPYYYRDAIRQGIVRAGDYSPGAVEKVAQHLGGYVASPGYSNHQDGLAFDFGEDPDGKGLRKLKWKSWFRQWLKKNAVRHRLEPLSTEAWHWTYRPPGGASEVWAEEIVEEVPPAAVPPKRVEVARVPLLARHRGDGPDVVLRWNALPSAPEAIDVVVHLHGFWYPRLRLPRDIEPVSGLDLAPPGSADGQGRARPTLTVLPRGHDTGVKQRHGSYSAYTFPALVTKDGLDELIRVALERFAATVGGSTPRISRLILTAHSGGGLALLNILRHHNPHQVHVFDALYWDPEPLVEWARRRIRTDRDALATGAAPMEYMSSVGGALRVFYQGRYRGGTRPRSLVVRRALEPELGGELLRWYRVEASNYDHFQIPRRYGWRVLANASADVPDAWVERADERPHEFSEDETERALESALGDVDSAEIVDESLEDVPEGVSEAPEDEWEEQEAYLWTDEEDEDGELQEPEALDELEDVGAPVSEAEEADELRLQHEGGVAVQMLEAIGRGLWDTAVRIAIGTGITDASELTNTLFYLRHPDMRGKKIGTDQPDLAHEWLQIRDRWVKPALRAHAAGATAPPAATTVRIKPVKSGHAAYGGGRLEDSLRRLARERGFSISERDIDTLQRIADVESSGLTNALNSWDNAVVSLGFKQWTLRWGELQDLIGRAPEAFARHGVRLAPPGTNYTFSSKGKTWTQWAIDGVPNKETLRNEDWGRRLFLAGLEPEAVAAAAQKALADVAKVEQTVRAKHGWSPHLDSPRGRALLVELDNNRPVYVRIAVPRTLAAANARPGIGEDEFLAIFVAEIVAAYAAREHDAEKGRRWTGKIMRELGGSARHLEDVVPGLAEEFVEAR